MEYHTIFPTVIGEEIYADNESVKEVVFDTYIEKANGNGFSHERTGRVYLHHEERYRFIFEGIAQAIEEYLYSIGIPPATFDINITKSWFNAIREKNTPKHGHFESQFSFVYYVNIPDDNAKPITFYVDDAGPNEPYNDFFEANNFEWNYFNAKSWTITPQEGSILVFPSKVLHATTGDFIEDAMSNSPTKTIEDLRKKRISIAGDITLTYCEPYMESESNQPTKVGLQPVNTWRKF